jgi:hypothetical protein
MDLAGVVTFLSVGGAEKKRKIRLAGELMSIDVTLKT